MAKLKHEDKLLAFLENATVMIVDKSTSSRTRLAKTMNDLGCKNHNIVRVGHFSEAVTHLTENKPDIILSDYNIGGGSGFDLFKSLRESEPTSRKSILILVTSNISQSAVAKAAEEDVDAFIIKPYTIASLKQNLLTSIHDKLYPSEYIQAVEKGKLKLFNGEYEAALELFDQAKTLSKSPSLALFYHGTTEKLIGAKDEAINDFEKGLTYNHIHFKCQIGLFEMFMNEQRFYDAYEIVKRIAKYFPSNPERLQQVIRLAVITENYVDMEFYYEIFKNLDVRDSSTIKYISAGMFVFGKYLVRKGDYDRAVEVFDKVAISCEGNGRILRGIIEVLYNSDQMESAHTYLKRFAAGAATDEDYIVANFLVDCNGLNDHEKINQALEIINQNIHSIEVYECLIAAMNRQEYVEKAKKFQEQALEQFPTKKRFIKGWIKDATKTA